MNTQQKLQYTFEFNSKYKGAKRTQKCTISNNCQYSYLFSTVRICKTCLKKFICKFYYKKHQINFWNTSLLGQSLLDFETPQSVFP